MSRLGAWIRREWLSLSCAHNWQPAIGTQTGKHLYDYCYHCRSYRNVASWMQKRVNDDGTVDWVSPPLPPGLRGGS